MAMASCAGMVAVIGVDDVLGSVAAVSPNDLDRCRLRTFRAQRQRHSHLCCCRQERHGGGKEPSGSTLFARHRFTRQDETALLFNAGRGAWASICPSRCP